MSKYRIDIIKAVNRDLKSFKHHRQEAVDQLKKLEYNPLQKSKALQGNLQELYSFQFNVQNIKHYRAIFYPIAKDKICLLILVGTRDNIYQQANKRWQKIKKELE